MIRTPTTRRRFFGLVGGGAVAGRQVIDHAAKQLAIGNISVGSGAPTPNLRHALFDEGPSAIGADNPNQTSTIPWAEFCRLRDNLLRKALETPEKRVELESILYTQFRNIHWLDPDLAYNRSFSMAAKLCYQRQRLVQREINDSVEEKAPWHRLKDWKNGVLSVLDRLGIKFV
jgi:hypothetical protein